MALSRESRTPYFTGMAHNIEIASGRDLEQPFLGPWRCGGLSVSGASPPSVFDTSHQEVETRGYLDPDGRVNVLFEVNALQFKRSLTVDPGE